MEPEVKEEEIPAYMGSQALRSNSPASCLQLVKQEPLAGSEHGMPCTAAQATLSPSCTCLHLMGSHAPLALCGSAASMHRVNSQQQQHGRPLPRAALGRCWMRGHCCATSVTHLVCRLRMLSTAPAEAQCCRLLRAQAQ